MKILFGWGFLLWFIGYLLGILLLVFVPQSLLGWVIMPFGIIITLWVLFKKVNLTTFEQYIRLAIIWTVIAVICDYIFLVKIFNPADGYYKLDVYLYYCFTFLLPLFVGWMKTVIAGFASKTLVK